LPIHAAKNLYRGVNPHLNSLLQNRDGEWQSFHATHIADMRRMVEVQLPPNYYARSEKTLQVADLAFIDEEEWPTAAVIYVTDEDGTAYPCTRIGLSSPANKPPNSGHKLYQTKRLDTLRAGIRLIELDYLHQSRPPLVALPRLYFESYSPADQQPILARIDAIAQAHVGSGT
jgi:hypothetical protein